LGRVLVEAQAMATPVVAYATGGVPEGLKDGKTGYLVPTGDGCALADRLKELLTDAETRAEFGRQGRAFATSHFSLAALADRHELFYMSAIAQKAGRPSPCLQA
jgi:glycosyltransferase involved in cell wall biosynthesis